MLARNREFRVISCYFGMLLLGIEFPIDSRIGFLFGTSLFRRKMKWAQKDLSVENANLTVIENVSNRKCIGCIGQRHDYNWWFLKEQMIRYLQDATISVFCLNSLILHKLRFNTWELVLSQTVLILYIEVKFFTLISFLNIDIKQHIIIGFL